MESNRRRFAEALLAGVVCSAVIVLTTMVVRFGVSTKDIIAFIGSVMGTGLAVSGALFVERVKRTDIKKDRIAAVEQSLMALFTRSVGFPASDPKQVKIELIGILQDIDTLREVKVLCAPDEPAIVMMLTTLTYWEPRYRDIFSSALADLDANRATVEDVHEFVKAPMEGLANGTRSILDNDLWPNGRITAKHATAEFVQEASRVEKARRAAERV